MVRDSLPSALCFVVTLLLMIRGLAIAEATAADQRVAERAGSEDGSADVFVRLPGHYSKYFRPYLLMPRSPRGPQPKNKGLILEVEFDQQDCLLGEPLLVRCSLVNCSAKPIELVYDPHHYSQNRFLFEITAPNGEQLPFAPRMLIRRHGMPSPIEIQPGHRLVAMYNLFDEYAIHEVGDYKISARYRSDGWWSAWRMSSWRDDLWRGDLTRSLGTVRIVAPTKDVDKAGLRLLDCDPKGRSRRSYSPSPFQFAFGERRRTLELTEKYGGSRYAAYARYFRAVEELAWAEKTGATSPKLLKPAIAHLKAIDTAGFPRLFQELCLFNLLYAHAVLNAEPPAGVSKQRFVEQFPDSPFVFVLKQPQFKDLD